MKKVLSILMCLVVGAIALAGCDLFGTTYVTDIAEYGQVDSSIEFPQYFPDTVQDLKVNSYSYTVYNYMDICYEIFLDVTVDNDKFIEMLKEIKDSSASFDEQEAYYAEGYKEIVFTDRYSLCTQQNTQAYNDYVWRAKVEKVVYNPDTNNIIFECFNAFDSGVYALNDVAYFNRFGINQTEYVKYADEIID